jgi:hypothetical protein
MATPFVFYGQKNAPEPKGEVRGMKVLTGVKTPAQGGETGSSLRYSDVQTGLCENSSSDLKNFRK